jgi:hypothetical protein
MLKSFLRGCLIALLAASPALASQVSVPALPGTVTATGSPASGNLAVFSGPTSVTDGDLSGDATTSGTSAVTVSKTGGVPFAPSATIDTTNASNVSSGTLPCARLPALTGDTTSSAGSCATTTAKVGGDANVAFTDANQTWIGQRGKVQTIALSGAVATPDFNGFLNYSLTLVHASCPCTFANPVALPVAGQSGVIVVIQSAIGTDAIGTWGSDYITTGGVSGIALSSAASAVDVFGYYVVDSTHILLTTGALNATH